MKKAKKISRTMIIAVIGVMISSQIAFATSQIDSSNTLDESPAKYYAAIDMTENEVLDLYQDFVETQPSNSIELDKFVDYAVRQGAIADTPTQRAAITKSLVRASFKDMANIASVAGYTTGSACLLHSLQDNPSRVYITTSDPISKQIKKSSECKSIINTFKNDVRGKKLSACTTSGSTTLNSTTDLFLAFNKMSWIARGTKASNGTWKLTITFSDTYDFVTENWKKKLSYNSKAVTILNNYGAYAQSIGAIVPYKISVDVATTFTE